jgi:hypothetical protein
MHACALVIELDEGILQTNGPDTILQSGVHQY